jgi:hypothetical protein
MILRIKSLLLVVLLGDRVKGEKLSEPTFTTTYVGPVLSESQWTKYVGFGRRWMMNIDWKDQHRQMMNSVYKVDVSKDLFKV